METPPSIRMAGASDIEQICQLDTDASYRFASIPALEDLSSGSHGCLQSHAVEDWLATGTIYVVEEQGRMLGFTSVQPKDGVLYIAELSVSLHEQGRGLGSLLLEQVFSHARSTSRDGGSEIARVSLTTYPDVPWNGPWYRKRGFREIEGAMIGSWHVGKVQRDAEDLARLGYRRCCMLWEEPLISPAPM